MVKRLAVLATDPPNTVPRPVVALLRETTTIVELDSAVLKGVREGGKELIPVGSEPVVDSGDGREDESGVNGPVKLEAAE